MTILGYCWFSGVDNVGIVYGIDNITNEKKAYIGIAVGLNEDADINHIAEYGAHFPIDEAISLCEKCGVVLHINKIGSTQ